MENSASNSAKKDLHQRSSAKLLATHKLSSSSHQLGKDSNMCNRQAEWWTVCCSITASAHDETHQSIRPCYMPEITNVSCTRDMVPAHHSTGVPASNTCFEAPWAKALDFEPDQHRLKRQEKRLSCELSCFLLVSCSLFRSSAPSVHANVRVRRARAKTAACRTMPCIDDNSSSAARQTETKRERERDRERERERDVSVFMGVCVCVYIYTYYIYIIYIYIYI